MAIDGRFISLAHLCMMEVPPVQLVRAAAAAGYDGVGIRLVPTSDGVDHQVLGNDAKMAELKRAVDESGLTVLDIEVVRVKAEGPGEVRPLLEAGALLGARHVICTVEDPDPVRRIDRFAAFSALADSYGVRANLEFMVFSAVPTLLESLAIIEASGSSASVLVDPLHHERGGGVSSDVDGVPTSLLPYIQLCDATPAGAAADPMDARREAGFGRLLPGDGDLPLRELLAHLDPTTAISVESPLTGERRPEDPAAWAARALDATRRVLAP